MNPIAALQKELDVLQAQYGTVRGLVAFGPRYLSMGTAPFIGTDAERAAIARATAILSEIKMRLKHAGLRHKTSSVAHGGHR